MPTRKYESRGGPGLADLARIIRRESTELVDDRLALADFIIINLVAGAPDGHAKNISLLREPGYTALAPLYDLASGLAYASTRVDRSVALSIGGERVPSRIRRRQWQKAADSLALDPHLLCRRVEALAEGYPGAFEAVLARLPAGTPGVAEIADRALPELSRHSGIVLDGL